MPGQSNGPNVFRIEERSDRTYRLYAGRKYVCKLGYLEGVWWNHAVPLEKLLPMVADHYPPGLMLQTPLGRSYGCWFSRPSVYTYGYGGPIVTLTAKLPGERGWEAQSHGKLLSAMTDEAGKAGGMVIRRPSALSETRLCTVGLPWTNGTFERCLDDVRLMMDDAFQEACYQSQLRVARESEAQSANLPNGASVPDGMASISAA